MKRRILLLTQYFPPETGAGANRIGPMADVLSKHYEVAVVALEPSYPSPSEYKDVHLEAHDAGRPYPVRRTFDFHPHKGSLLFRALREQAMALRLALYALRDPGDIVITSSPSMFLGPVTLVLARAKNARFVWDIRDITWGYARDFAGPSPLMALATRVLERYVLWALRQADLIVGASHGITRLLVEEGVDPGRAITVPNGVSTELLDAITREVDRSQENQRPMVAYAGLIGYNQGLGVLLQAASMLPDVDFVLAGDGPELALLKDKAKQLGVSNIVFTGFLNREKLLELYRQSDVLIAHARSGPTIDATMVPVKLFEYMATGRPIIYAGKGIAADLMRQIGCAVTVPPENPEAIKDAVVELLLDPEQMRVLGLRGRACVQKHYHRDELMEGLARTLGERFAGRPAHDDGCDGRTSTRPPRERRGRSTTALASGGDSWISALRRLPRRGG
jgi:glycosyltransferase involved in cell wall biosynthesis